MFLFTSSSSFGQVVETDFPIVPSGTLGCWVDVDVSCSDHPDKPDLTLCSANDCIRVVENGQEIWKCPQAKEYYIGQGESYFRITDAQPAQSGFTEFFDTVGNCGISNTCSCPAVTPPPEGTPPACDWVYGSTGPGFNVMSQLTKTWSNECLGVGVGSGTGNE